jgi:hypothetical protein
MDGTATKVYRGGRSRSRIPLATTKVRYDIEGDTLDRGTVRVDFHLGPDWQGTRITMNTGLADVAKIVALAGATLKTSGAEDAAEVARLLAKLPRWWTGTRHHTAPHINARSPMTTNPPTERTLTDEGLFVRTSAPASKDPG